jgi:hypothetical protein
MYKQKKARIATQLISGFKEKAPQTNLTLMRQASANP